MLSLEARFLSVNIDKKVDSDGDRRKGNETSYMVWV